MVETDINWKAFAFLFIVGQVLAPAQIDYFFHTVPKEVDDFTLMDSIWNFAYFECMIVIFAFAGTGMVYIYEYINERNIYKPEKV